MGAYLEGGMEAGKVVSHLEGTCQGAANQRKAAGAYPEIRVTEACQAVKAYREEGRVVLGNLEGELRA